MKILDRLPILEAGWIVPTPDGAEEVKPYQIIVLVSIADEGLVVLPDDAPRFPAILDTGNNHNFAIRQEQFERWTPDDPASGGAGSRSGLHPSRSSPPTSGSTRTDRARSIRVDKPPFRLELQGGIAVYPPDVPNPARLPILGLRGLIRNRLRLTIDGDGRESDPRIPFRLSPIAFHPTPATVTSGSRMRTLDKRVMDRRLHSWD